MELGISPAYVLDEMQSYEINTLLKCAHYKNRELWEQTRMIMYVIAQVNSRKKLLPKDVFSFPWDNENTDSNSSNVNDSEIIPGEKERLQKKMEEYIKSKMK